MKDAARDALVMDAWAALKGANVAVLGRVAKEAEKLEATPAQIGLLRMLLEPGAPATPQAIARRLEVTPATVTAALNRLEDAGLLTRVRESDDRRVVHVRVTPKGRALATKWVETFRAHLHASLGHLSDDELRALAGLLTRVGPPIHGPPGGFGALLRHDAMRGAKKGARKGAKAAGKKRK